MECPGTGVECEYSISSNYIEDGRHCSRSMVSHNTRYVGGYSIGACTIDSTRIKGIDEVGGKEMRKYRRRKRERGRIRQYSQNSNNSIDGFETQNSYCVCSQATFRRPIVSNFDISLLLCTHYSLRFI